MIYAIALMIDSENISYKDLPHILEETDRLGKTVLRIAYGDWESANLQSWREVAERNNFTLRHQTNSTTSKNAADMRLIMDAMDIIHHRKDIDLFCLVTNDADYVPLCERIRENRKRIVGVGYAHASDTLIRACNQFIFIENGTPPANVDKPKAALPAKPEKPSNPPTKAKKQNNPQQPKQPKKIEELLAKAYEQAPKDAQGWVLLASLGSVLRQINTDFKSTNYGHATLSKLLKSMPHFVELRDKGGATSARLKK